MTSKEMLCSLGAAFGGQKRPGCTSLTSAGLTNRTTKPSKDFVPCPLNEMQDQSVRSGADPSAQGAATTLDRVPGLLPACSLTLGKSPPSLLMLLCTDHNISLSYSAEGGED